jgi:hypothetical protein
MRIFSKRARNEDYDNTRNDDYDNYDGDGTTTTTGETTPPSTAIRRAYADRQAPATTADAAPTTRQTAATADTAQTTRETAATTAPVDADDGRRWHHGPTRAVVTLLAAAVAGLLAWTTTNISHNTTGGYWAVYGILAGAGLVMALSQLLGGWTKWGRPTFSPTVFLLAFVPTAIAVGWILLFHQPHSTLWRGNVANWSGNIGVDGIVKDMGGNLLTMLSFGLGLVFGFCFDTTPALRRRVTPAPATARRYDTDADDPIARERLRERNQETVRS